MKSLFQITGFIGLLSLSCAFAPAPVHATSLKQHSIIKDSTITLGDIFYDLPRDVDRVLGTAPRPGQEMVLDARTLLRIALALDLSWRPSGQSDHIVLRREASIVSYEQIADAIHTALYDKGVNGKYELEIPERYQQIILPADMPSQVEITRFTIDADRKKFQATMAAPSAKNPVQHIMISGKISPVIQVPVLVENLQNGYIITKNDIEYISIKEREYSKDMIVDADALVGMTARRIVLADRPVRKSDLIAPQVVERGSIVNMSLANSIMQITTQAKALQNGATGDIIRVVNTASNQTLQARVTGPNEVVVLN